MLAALVGGPDGAGECAVGKRRERGRGWAFAAQGDPLSARPQGLPDVDQDGGAHGGAAPHARARPGRQGHRFLAVRLLPRPDGAPPAARRTEDGQALRRHVRLRARRRAHRLQGGPLRQGDPHLAQGGRRGAQPHRGLAHLPHGPVVESGGGVSGHRPRSSPRPDKAHPRGPLRRTRDCGGTNPPAAGQEAPGLRGDHRRRRRLALAAERGGPALPLPELESPAAPQTLSSHTHTPLMGPPPTV
mmetsp:Transcript_30689/g.65964  ORF Transcript_30689/g.65964 Transcript_30689/m.65964 type:complete len:244 (-) Transcript_30689:210-941(-)